VFCFLSVGVQLLLVEPNIYPRFSAVARRRASGSVTSAETLF